MPFVLHTYITYGDFVVKRKVGTEGSNLNYLRSRDFMKPRDFFSQFLKRGGIERTYVLAHGHVNVFVGSYITP